MGLEPLGVREELVAHLNHASYLGFEHKLHKAFRPLPLHNELSGVVSNNIHVRPFICKARVIDLIRRPQMPVQPFVELLHLRVSKRLCV